jgi:CHAT domain-containing protein
MINKRPDIQSFSRQMKEMVAQSKMLYATLVAPLLSSDGLPAHLLLIPDGPINYVPFEAFVIDTPPGNQIPDYMVNHTDVAYSYGFTLQGLHRVSQNDFKHSLLAVAPLFLAGKAAGNNDNNGNWQPIEGALEEVKAVTALFPSHIARVEEENHAWFMNNLGNFNVLHLATHAFANEQNPFESGLLLDGGSHAGQKGVLTVSDLYHTSLPTELVVLSACNTGFGPVKRGEGVVSLAHGFAYAGSPAVAMALWPANDQTTRMVVTQFYKTLLEGNTKSNALTAAKRNYLRDADVYKGHPYFWAGMVFIGLNDPLTLSASFPWFWGVLIFCTACLGVFFLIRRLQRSRAV